jgi:hypothetical protein
MSLLRIFLSRFIFLYHDVYINTINNISYHFRKNEREPLWERSNILTIYFILIIMSLCPTLFPFIFSIPNFTKLFFSSFKLFLGYNLFYFSKSFAKSIPSPITSLTSPLNIHLHLHQFFPNSSLFQSSKHNGCVLMAKRGTQKRGFCMVFRLKSTATNWKAL